CSLKQQCCPNMPSRRIVRDVNEAARDVARRKMKTKAFLRSRDQRKRVEMRFARLKTHHGFERVRLRGLSGARDEFHLVAIVQNLKTMALRLFAPLQQAPVCHPTGVFYQTILVNNNYSALLSKIGNKYVDRPGFKMGPTNGRQEILYCRRNGWLVDDQ